MNWLKSFWKRLSTPLAGEHGGSGGPHGLLRGIDGGAWFDETLGNFTPRAQRVLSLAREEAERFHHNFVGTEHLLLGLIRLGQGTAVTVLEKMGLYLETVRWEVEKQIGTGPDQRCTVLFPIRPV